MENYTRTDVLGVGFDSLTMDEAVSRALELIKDGGAHGVVTPNPEIIMLCRENEALRRAVNGADMVLPDGVGVVKGAERLGTPLKEKLPGIDFARALMAELAKDGGGVFLFGSKPGVAETAAERLSREYPGLCIVGTNDGYFDDDGPIIKKINAAAPRLLLVCLGSPKQELWIAENLPRLNVGLAAGLGGSLDVFAGTVKRAPERWQRAGLEWLYRLIKEPSRLGRMMRLPKFILAVEREKRRRKKNAG